uniref:Alpha-amylase family glycosyl hydrolase n=1 Tax=Roseihalotalea indica TaxID=2867963 RepID=A0AA49GTQ1_9BACT|nr:alpha-amylase family glycosyl hydrolase [Tunicatimonas sp. TK19036]
MNKFSSSWAWDSVFYHIYPLGLTGAPRQNNFSSQPEPRLEGICPWLDHMAELGCNALYLGPVFESGTHGYDTADYFQVDRRLGTNETLRHLVKQAHDRGIRVILDGVFNHVGRNFWAFKDLQQHKEQSVYKDWFAGVDFNQPSPNGDSFTYESWEGHYDLIKLNLHHSEVRKHLFDAVAMWIEEFDIDGLRLDAADVMDLGFLQALRSFCQKLRPDFWLVGEVIHGDYTQWANAETLHATTNYECYKGLYSSHNDANYFEIAHSLNREFGPGGVYQGLPLYTFADNHDVNRVASTLENSAHLYPLYALLFTMPGVPSIYYGSEWGIEGKKEQHSDDPLRPAVCLEAIPHQAPHPDLVPAIQQFISLRHQQHALRYGNYQQLMVTSEQFAFSRQSDQDFVMVAVNSADTSAALDIPVPLPDGQVLTNLLEPDSHFTVQGGSVSVKVPSCWATILA